MKKFVLLLAAAGVLGAEPCIAQEDRSSAVDTLRAYELDDVQVVSLRSTSRTPMAHTDLSRDDIQTMNFGQDMPLLLSTQPSVTVTTDAGNGIGYTSIRIRGTDPARINVTANGVPLNDGESSILYFCDLPDFASSLRSLQIQRGVGTSTNGAGAFGATINMLTEGVPSHSYFALDVSAGSYATHKETLRFGTGLLKGHFGLQGRLSHISSNGYIDRATSRLNSYFLQAGYYGENTSVKFITFNGTERTYMAWNYSSKYEQSLYGRRYNPCGFYYDAQGNPQFYADQYDNYHQQHYQLHLNQLLGQQWKLNVALHYTHDTYDYDQMKAGKKLYLWLLTDDTSMRGNLVQRKDGVKDFFGIVASANCDNRRGLTASFGGGWNHMNVDQYGRVLWVGTPYYKGAEDTPLTLPGLQPKHQYLTNNAKKNDFNIYAKIQWEFVRNLSLFADLQYRRVGYLMSGMSDQWDDNGQHVLDVDEIFNFFNPKFGLNYEPASGHRFYASYAIAHREPTRDNYNDNWEQRNTSERLNDIELGYQFSSSHFSAGINLYHMDYHDQFVLTGLLDDDGEAITRNLPRSYRMGIELEAAWHPVDWFRWNVNATVSRNRVRDMQVTLDDYTTTINLGERKLAFSPDVILNNSFNFHYRNFSALVQLRYVGKQNLTNYGFEQMYSTETGTMESLVLDDHFTTNLDLSYSFKLPQIGVKRARAGITFYNLFSTKYDTNGWAVPQFRQDANGRVYAVNTWGPRDAEAVGLSPAAPFNFMAHLSIDF